MRADDPVMRWLLDPAEPAVRYLASRDLVTPRPNQSELVRLRSEIPLRGWAATILSRQREDTWWERKDTAYWPKVNGTYWCLAVLADLGLSRGDARVERAMEHMLRIHLARDGGFSPYGPPEPSHFCSTGIMLRTLVQLGYGDDPRAGRAIEWLLGTQLSDGGWDCRPSREGTLDAWEAIAAFAAIPEPHRGAEVRRSIAAAAEFYLDRRLLHEGAAYPRWYQLHYPRHYWYDVLVGLDFLTALGYGADPRMQEGVALLRSKRGADGCWTLEGTNGNLRLEGPGKPSKMVTFLSLRVLQRVEQNPRRTSPAEPRAGRARRGSEARARSSSRLGKSGLPP